MNYQCLANQILHFASERFLHRPCLHDEGVECKDLAERFDEAMKQWGISYSFASFLGDLKIVEEYLQEDLETAYKGDPAAKSKEEILYAYPGYYALMTHRIAHVLFKQGIPVLPRVLSEIAHSRTGIDIHPGATIGHNFFIDHGTGIVIGETAEIGNNVRLYQGVTLGAKSLDNAEELRGKKRHPTIKDNVIIYSGASILGGDTVIGKGCVIGSNVFITFSIPDNQLVRFENKNYSITPKK